jgi:hypothetical protein
MPTNTHFCGQKTVHLPRQRGVTGRPFGLACIVPDERKPQVSGVVPEQLPPWDLGRLRRPFLLSATHLRCLQAILRKTGNGWTLESGATSEGGSIVTLALSVVVLLLRHPV